MFEGPFAFTASGIFDKGLAFLRVRVVNNSDHPFNVSPVLFQAMNPEGQVLPLLSPKEVLCFMYGEPGARLLATRLQKKTAVDATPSLAATATPDSEGCPANFHGQR